MARGQGGSLRAQERRPLTTRSALVPRHACSGPFVIPAGPSVIPAGPPCHSRRSPSVIPAGPPLSFPPVVSGNPVSFSSVPSFTWSRMEKALDSRLKMSGMTEGIEDVGNDRAESCTPAWEKPWILQAFCHACSVPFGMPARSSLSFLRVLSVRPAGPPLSFPPVVSGNPVSFSFVPSFMGSCMGKALDSRLKMSGMTAGD